MKYRWVLFFISAYLLNFLWEEWHSQFYTHFMGGSITHSVLAYAALVDASIILVLGLVAFQFKPFWQQLVIMIGGGLLWSLVLEWHALATNRWAYAPSMVIIPISNTGLTPTIQLALLGVIAYCVVFKLNK